MDEWSDVKQDRMTAGIGCQSDWPRKMSLSCHHGYQVEQLAGSLGEPHQL